MPVIRSKRSWRKMAFSVAFAGFFPSAACCLQVGSETTGTSTAGGTAPRASSGSSASGTGTTGRGTSGAGPTGSGSSGGGTTAAASGTASATTGANAGGSATGGGTSGGSPPACPAVLGPFVPDAGCATTADCLDPSTTCQNGHCLATPCCNSPTCTTQAICNAAGQEDGVCTVGGGGCDVLEPDGLATTPSCVQGGDAGAYCCMTADRSTPWLLCPGGEICVAFPGESLGTCHPPCQMISHDNDTYLINCPSPGGWACIPLVCNGAWVDATQSGGPGACYPAGAGTNCQYGGCCGLGAFPTELSPCGVDLSNGCACPMGCNSSDSMCEYACDADGGCSAPGRVCTSGFCTPLFQSFSVDAGCPPGEARFGTHQWPSYCFPICQTVADCPAGSWDCNPDGFVCPPDGGPCVDAGVCL